VVTATVQAQQATGVEAHEPGPLGLDRCPDRLEADQQPLPGIGHARRVRSDERQLGATRKRLAQAHSGMDPEGLRGERDLAHLLDLPGLGRKCGGALQELGTIAGSGRQLKTRDQYTDDHGHAERMFARAQDGLTSTAVAVSVAVVRSRRMAPPNPVDLASQGVRTLKAFSRRIPVGGGVLAPSLEDAVTGRNVMITGASSGIGKAAALRIGKAGGIVLLVARSQDQLEEVKREIEELDGIAYVHRCDLTNLDDIDRMAGQVLEQHEAVDILVNNAGKSIRRSINRAYDRFHDYQRTMQLNYFAPVKLILALLPMMREQQSGHIINISTIGLQMNTPRFSAYVASKAALDAFSRSVGPEVIGDGVHITTVYMPLVRTPMIAPTKIYDRFPTLSPEEAADLITEAIRKRPKRIATTLGSIGQLSYAIAPGAQDLVVNRAYQLFPEGDGDKKERIEDPTPEQRAFARATRGVHW